MITVLPLRLRSLKRSRHLRWNASSPTASTSSTSSMSGSHIDGHRKPEAHVHA